MQLTISVIQPPIRVISVTDDGVSLQIGASVVTPVVVVTIVAPIGLKGDPGADSLVPGPAGPTGPQGDPGAAGPQGDTGATGPQGAQGIQGAPGLQGIQGETGATGPQGPQGDTGATGPQGIQGEPGAVSSVAGKTGAVTLVKADVGLPLADNTADVNKPISLPAKNYIQSRGQNLITNGSGLLADNTNFSTFTFSAAETHGGGGSFQTNAAASARFNDEYIAVDPTKRLRLAGWGKSGDVNGANFNPANRQYLGLVFYDADLNRVDVFNSCKYTTAADTTLAAPLNPGDTTVTLANATGWYAGPIATWRQFCWYGWTNSMGYTYPDFTYTRNLSRAYDQNSTLGTWLENGIAGNVVTLRVPWSGPALPAGATIRNNLDGGTYAYIAAASSIVPNVWTRYEGSIYKADGSAVSNTNQFRAGTAYVRVLFLVNYQNTTDNIIRWSDLSLSELAGENLEPASATTPGVVTPMAQTWAGEKTFTSPIAANQYRLADLNAAPATATATGTLGEIRITSTFIYVCIGTNTWVRSALATW